jgi:prepilin-type N-terminal cleavage/methylation domain-containing protein
MSRLSQRHRRTASKGFSLIELLIAMLVLTIGLLGGMIVIVTAIASNARSRLDTTGVALAQSTMDRIIVLSISAATQSTAMIDCDGVSHNITTVASDSPGSGAPLTDISNLPDGNQMIDFSQAPVTIAGGGSGDYQMLYKLCATGGDNGASTTKGPPQIYDVRWHITNIANSSAPGNTELVLVAAKNVGEAGNGITQSKFFTVPITLRAVRGN